MLSPGVVLLTGLSIGRCVLCVQAKNKGRRREKKIRVLGKKGRSTSSVGLMTFVGTTQDPHVSSSTQAMQKTQPKQGAPTVISDEQAVNKEI